MAKDLKAMKNDLFVVAALFGLAIAAVGGWLIYHQTKTVADLAKQMQIMENKIKIQEKLFLPRNNLQMMLEQEALKELKMPGNSAMTGDQVSVITNTFEEIIKNASLNPLTVIPDPKSLRADPTQLYVECAFYGDFENFRDFIKDLGANEYIRHIQVIDMAEGHDEGLNYTVGLKLSVK